MRVAFLATLGLASCTVGPNYRADRPALPPAFQEHAATPDELARTHLEMRAWWATFGDPVLDDLVERAIGNNLDLRIQTQNIIVAQALRNEQRAAFYPQIQATALAADQHLSVTDQYPPGAGLSGFNRDYQGGALLDWQIDVFGGIRRSVQAADANLGATIEQRRGVLVSLLAELVDQYATLRASQLRLSIAQNNVRIARQSLDLTVRTFNQGIGTSLQVAQAQAALETVDATIAPLRTAIDQAAHAISVLTGQLPEHDTAALEAPGPVPPVPPLPASLPSEVLVDRPDIRVAERRYAAAVAEIGVAVAALYPQFTLPLYAFPQSSAIHSLSEGASLVWQIGLSASMPIFTGGRLSNRIVAARATAEADRLSYEQTVLTAFQNVEDALVAYDNERVRHDRLIAAARDSNLAYQRAQLLFQHGLTGFLEVLTAENAVFSADDAVAVSTLLQLQDSVLLFRSIGAGWQGVDNANHTLPVSAAAENQAAASIRRANPALTASGRDRSP